MPTPTLNDRLRADLNASRKNREKLRTLVLTTFISEIRNREIELGAEAPDEEVQRLLGTAIKRRREAAEQMRQGGREELAAREDEEADQPRRDEREPQPRLAALFGAQLSEGGEGAPAA